MDGYIDNPIKKHTKTIRITLSYAGADSSISRKRRDSVSEITSFRPKYGHENIDTVTQNNQVNLISILIVLNVDMQFHRFTWSLGYSGIPTIRTVS